MPSQALSVDREPNPQLLELARGAGESNTDWGERAVAEMGTGGSDAWAYLVLLGGSDTMAFRLRVAQSHLRRDMLPSYWSEAILVDLKANSVADAGAISVPLIQPGGPEFSTRSNGVVEQPLLDFDDPERFPNIALIALPVPQAKILARVKTFGRSRSTLDALEHVLRWLAFAWGAGRTPNPLHDNFGLPSACMLETVCAACNFDLTPGLEARAACPEAIWVSARYWQSYYAEFSNGKVPTGRFFTPHAYPIMDPGGDFKATRRMPRTGAAAKAPKKAAKRRGAPR